MYIATYILSLLDLAFTLYFKYRFGDSIEGNPFGRLLLTNEWFAVIFKVVVVGVAVYLLYRFRKHDLAIVCINLTFAAYACLTVYHVVLMGITHYILFMEH